MLQNVQHMFLGYAICTLIILVKAKCVNFWGVNSDEHPPEDKDLPKLPVPADIKRRQRAIMNDLENLPVDMVVFWAGALTCFVASAEAEALALTVLMATYTGARVLHTTAYLGALQPWRTIAMVLGMCSVLSAAGVLVSAASKIN